MRKKRLLAVVIDFVLIILVSQLFLYFIEQSIWLKITFSLMFTLFLCRDNLNGQSLGKRFMKIQVVGNNAIQSVTSFKYILRNQFLCVWPIELLIVLILGDRRLGDYIAKTKIITNTETQPTIIKLKDIAVFLICFVIVYLIVEFTLKLSASGFPLIKLLF